MPSLVDRVKTYLESEGVYGRPLYLTRKLAENIVAIVEDTQLGYMTGTWYAAADIDALVKELDIAWNGAENAAEKPLLCDIVAQIKRDLCKMHVLPLHPKAQITFEEPT